MNAVNTKLFVQAVTRFLAGLFIVGLLLFLPAGTFAFWQAWLLIFILFVPMFIAGLILMKKSPDLLQKRLNAKEEQTEQKTVILLSGLMFLAAFIAAGLNFRFGWFALPGAVSFAAAIVFLLAYVLYAEVMRENAYLSRTVEVQENQSVISFAIMLAYIPIISKRIRNEEQVLEEGLEGYREYKQRVRYKVIPFVW